MNNKLLLKRQDYFADIFFEDDESLIREFDFIENAKKKYCSIEIKTKKLIKEINEENFFYLNIYKLPENSEIFDASFFSFKKIGRNLCFKGLDAYSGINIKIDPKSGKIILRASLAQLKKNPEKICNLFLDVCASQDLDIASLKMKFSFFAGKEIKNIFEIQKKKYSEQKNFICEKKTIEQKIEKSNPNMVNMKKFREKSKKLKMMLLHKVAVGENILKNKAINNSPNFIREIKENREKYHQIFLDPSYNSIEKIFKNKWILIPRLNIVLNKIVSKYDLPLGITKRLNNEKLSQIAENLLSDDKNLIEKSIEDLNILIKKHKFTQFKSFNKTHSLANKKTFLNYRKNFKTKKSKKTIKIERKKR